MDKEGRSRGEAVPIILCADDYGIAPGVSGAIRDLIAQGRLTATSCMAITEHWEAEGPRLVPMAVQADLGLHIVLTGGFAPLGHMPGLAPDGRLPGAGTLGSKAYLGLLSKTEVAQEIDRQIARFQSVMGMKPRYLDGHLHIHQLPMVGDVVLDRARRLGAYVRYASEPVAAILARRVAVVRTLAVTLMGRGFARSGRRAGVPGNPDMRGVRDFSAAEHYRELFPKFLGDARPNSIICCHPGRVDAALASVDPVTTQREDELAYFQSAAFPADLKRAGVRLARFQG